MLLAACTLGAPKASASTAVPPKGFEEAAAALDAAIAAKARPALERLVARDFIWVRGSGAKGDKAAFIAALTADSITIERFIPSDPRWILSSDSALLIGTNTLRGVVDDEVFVDRHHFADHWLWQAGQWQLVYAQVTRLPEPDSSK